MSQVSTKCPRGCGWLDFTGKCQKCGWVRGMAAPTGEPPICGGPAEGGKGFEADMGGSVVGPGVVTRHVTRVVEPEELRDRGFLLEVNRRFFHPLGLALSLVREGCGRLKVLETDDPSGWIYDWPGMSEAERADIAAKMGAIEGLERERREARQPLGFWIQPGPEAEKRRNPILMGTAEIVPKRSRKT